MLYQFPLQSSYRLAQISDCHLLADPGACYQQVNPARHLAAIVTQLQQEPPDAVLLTGDMTQDHSRASYQLLATLMAPLRCPVFCLPGNHDDLTELALLSQQAPFRPERSLVLANWQLLLLNTKGDTPAGYFSLSEQQWLTSECQRSVAEALWLFCHHHPLPLRSFIDKHGQQQQQQLWQAITVEPRIRGIAHGHTHYAYQREHLQRTVVGCPASSVQFLMTDDWQTQDDGPQWCDWNFTAEGQVHWQFRRLTPFRI
jgi:3',5'-cyclic-AMP phosphodiesterase